MLKKDKVFILRKIKYRESDLIIQCLNQSGARLSMLARGALKSRKRFGGGVLEPTHYVSASYLERTERGDQSPLHTLQEASILNSFPRLREDYDRLQCGLYFVKLVADMSREGEVDSSNLFNLLGNGLRAAELSLELEKLRIHFEVKLLGHQGVLPPEPSEIDLMRAAIAEHSALELTMQEWRRIGLRAHSTLKEYLA